LPKPPAFGQHKSTKESATGRFIKNNKLGIFGPDIRREVDDFVTYDLHYNFSLANLTGEESESALLVSGYNLTDEDPPRARLDLNYDPYTHNPLGRMIKVGLRHQF
jgi:hypothetical protein